MTFSGLIAGSLPHHNKYNSRSGRRVTRVIVHHWAGTAGGDTRLTDPNQEASANYILYSDGRLVGQVPEEYRAWTSGSWEADSYSITVEVQNTAAGGDWPVSEQSIAKLTDLIADIARRYGWGSVDRSRVTGHREFFATACPGPFLWARLPGIAANANAKLGGKPTPPVSPPTGGTDIEALARAVIRGDYGSGEERRRRLGANYGAVQARVNQILGGGGTTPPAQNNIEALAQAVIRGEYGTGDERKRRLGANYNAVQNRVNQILGGGGGGSNIEALAQAVIRGEYGTGEDRKRRLGSNYAAVQARVNQILG